MAFLVASYLAFPVDTLMVALAVLSGTWGRGTGPRGGGGAAFRAAGGGI
jgi:hypothetical protein